MALDRGGMRWLGGGMSGEATEVSIQGEYIELNKFLKWQGAAGTGGEAKLLVEEGQVRVDGEVERRLRRKLRPGCWVEVGGSVFRIA